MVNVTTQGNQIKVDSDANYAPWNAAWCSISFVGQSVHIFNAGIDKTVEATPNPFIIPLDEFQFNGTPLGTKDEITLALSTVIG